MRFSDAFVVALACVCSVSALPTKRDGPGQPYDCPNGSGASRKQQLQSQGATAQDLAITILETSCDMSGTAYPLGDIYPDGSPKTGDAANFGLFKNNWLMIRQHCSQFSGQTADQWQNGEALNTDDQAAITCQHEQITALGDTGFFNGQRGCGGTAGGADYASAVNYIEGYLNQGHLTDDSVTYYQLQNC